MAIFNSYVCLPEGTWYVIFHDIPKFSIPMDPDVPSQYVGYDFGA